MSKFKAFVAKLLGIDTKNYQPLIDALEMSLASANAKNHILKQENYELKNKGERNGNKRINR